ncbi:MAG: shikimate dehydrogenase [Magnetococcales bacterium]|nr:shikimate dehydrogenase [Magnetococcales bacterium]
MEPDAYSRRFLFGDGESRLLGVFGDPIAHSLSPKIHNLSLAQLDLNYRYLPFHVRPNHLKAALAGFKALGGVGFNATVPHKEALLPLMDRLDPVANKIGAVNTVDIQQDGTCVGYNTDAYGFLTALREQYSAPLADKNILVLGAGGACRAVLVALLDGGAKRILLANRTVERAKALADHLLSFSEYDNARITPLPLNFNQLPQDQIDILVNTTSLGLHNSDPLPLDLSRMGPQTLVYDIVYSSQGTPLQARAAALGLPIVDGLGMLIHQAARAFQIWTGEPMPVQLVKDQIFGINP